MFGRGIIKTENVYEFQTASIDTQDKINDVIEEKINNDLKLYKNKAKPIPTLPKKVDFESIKDYFDVNSLDVIIGIEKKSLNISKYDFSKNLINVISSNDLSIMQLFTNALFNQLKNKQSFQTMVIDAGDINILDNTKKDLLYENNDYNGFFEKILKYEKDCYDLYEKNNFNLNVLSKQKKILLVINGIDAFKNKLNLENKNKISEFFTKSKDLGIINFLIIDSIDNIKKVEYESWFKENFASSEGIWIGDGIEDQFTVKVSVRTDEVRQSVSDDFCFVLKRGKPVLVKYVSDFKMNNDDEDVLNLD